MGQGRKKETAAVERPNGTDGETMLFQISVHGPAEQTTCTYVKRELYQVFKDTARFGPDEIK